MMRRPPPRFFPEISVFITATRTKTYFHNSESAHANDKLDELLSGLSQDHIQSMADVETITQVLAGGATAGQIKIAPAERDVMLDFAKRERGHLAIENGIVMVIARKRLKDVDRESMCRAMRRRRGLTD